MINFFKLYWREIINVVAILISIVICCLKKKPVKVYDTLKEIICRSLPSLIGLVEKTDLKGDDKMKLLLDNLQEFLRTLGYGDEVIVQYLPFARCQVEAILDTPQKKKGEFNG